MEADWMDGWISGGEREAQEKAGARRREEELEARGEEEVAVAELAGRPGRWRPSLEAL